MRLLTRNVIFLTLVGLAADACWLGAQSGGSRPSLLSVVASRGSPLRGVDPTDQQEYEAVYGQLGCCSVFTPGLRAHLASIAARGGRGAGREFGDVFGQLTCCSAFSTEDRGRLAAQAARGGPGAAREFRDVFSHLTCCSAFSTEDRGRLAAQAARGGPGAAREFRDVFSQLTCCSVFSTEDRGGLAAQAAQGGPGAAREFSMTFTFLSRTSLETSERGRLAARVAALGGDATDAFQRLLAQEQAGTGWSRTGSLRERLVSAVDGLEALRDGYDVRSTGHDRWAPSRVGTGTGGRSSP